MKQPSDLKSNLLFSNAQRRYFHLTAATTGGAIMIIEILGAKMLAPYIGTSHFVWTAQIAVTLAALAVGYYWGGRWADRSPHPRSLYLGLLVAGLYVCGAVTQVERVAYACLHFKLALGSLLAAAFLFFIPLALLATVGPFLVRLLTQSLQNVGGSVGRLIAVSTLGSFAGTILIGYVLIPLLPNALTMILTAGAVMLVATVWLLLWGRKLSPKVVALLAMALGTACGWATQSKGLLVGPKLKEVFRGNSNFGQLQVIETRQGPQRRYLLNDFLWQGAYETQSRQSTLMFSYLLHDLARAYNTHVNDVLVIGLGVGLVPMQFAGEGAKVEVVEINPAVVPLARNYFDFQPERMNLTLGDGRQFINATSNRFDAIILDAFLGDSSPSHLMTREAFTAMRRLVRPDGVLVINCWGNFQPGKDFLVASLQKTLAAVFPSVRIHYNRHQLTENVANVFFVASPATLKIQRPPTFDHVHPICREQVEAAFSQVVEADPNHGIILTDDYNPVDYYDAPNREGARRDMARIMKP